AVYDPASGGQTACASRSAASRTRRTPSTRGRPRSSASDATASTSRARRSSTTTAARAPSSAASSTSPPPQASTSCPRSSPPTGLMEREVVEHCRQRIVAGVRQAGADGILLHLHGAAAADGIDDPEAYILRAVRSAVGPTVPVVVVYDLHANIGASWAEHAN